MLFVRKRYAVSQADDAPTMHTFWTLRGATRYYRRCIASGMRARLFKSDGQDWCEVVTSQPRHVHQRLSQG